MKKITSLLLISLFSFAWAQAPSGYYDGTEGLTGAALKTKLSAIITAGHKDNGYDGLYTGYPTTDTDHFYDNDGTVLDMYSEKPIGTDPYNFRHGQKKCGNYSAEGDCYNREHVIPQSFFKERRPMVSDIHHVRPTDGKVNGMRSNYPYGKVNNAAFTSKNGTKVGPSVSAGYSGSVCEPIDEFKGDIARMIFYFVTRYESQLSGFSSGNMLGTSAYPGLQTWERDVLLEWAALDPVSPSEIERNNAAFVFQKNRNPFIDHPEWVNQIWGSPIIDTQAPTAPTNLAVVSTSTASANLTWTAATDNVAVTSYKIYADGVFKTNSSTTTATVSGLNQGTTYSFRVHALDAAGNISPQSNDALGTTLTDNEAPTAPTNLTVTSVGSNNIVVSWNAATDNIGVASYDIYVGSTMMGTTSLLSSNIANLNPATTYSIYVVAKDAVGNVSPQSNTVTATTLTVGTTCGDEHFDNLEVVPNQYSTYNWESNGISWTSEDSRTDETINGKALTIRNGSLTALSVPNGIGQLTVTAQLKYSGTAGTLKLFVNDVDTGKTIPYGGRNSAPVTTTLTGIDVAGTVEIRLQQNGAATNRVAIDDVTWTCYTPSAAVTESGALQNKLTIFPNPVKHGELNVSGNNLQNVEVAYIFDFTGKMVQAIAAPFRSTSKISLKNLPKGAYMLKAGTETAKFIVE